jgi:hypothetical protein
MQGLSPPALLDLCYATFKNSQINYTLAKRAKEVIDRYDFSTFLWVVFSLVGRVKNPGNESSGADSFVKLSVQQKQQQQLPLCGPYNLLATTIINQHMQKDFALSAARHQETYVF